MSLSSLRNDNCELTTHNKQSAGPGAYMYNAPLLDCQQCFPLDPAIRLQKSGVNTCEQPHMIDVESELMNITRDAYKCPSKKYQATNDEFCKQVNKLADCDFLLGENTRIADPACSFLAGTAINRWEPLCKDPQIDEAIEPFFRNNNTRLIVKDNHLPCIPKPMDQTIGHPVANDNCITDLNKFKQSPNMNNYTRPIRPCHELNM